MEQKLLFAPIILLFRIPSKGPSMQKVNKESTSANQKTKQNRGPGIKKSSRESDELHRKLVESSLQGIVIAQGIPPRLVFTNPAISRILGYSHNELLSLTFDQTQNLIHPDDRSFFFSRYRDRLEGKSIDHPLSEIRAIRKDGSTVWLELSTTRIEYNGGPAVLATYVDITERKRSEKSLRESEERYRTILENIEDGYYEVDLEGNFIFFNDAVCRMLGFSRDEMMGMGNHRYTDPENRKKLFQAFNKVFQTGQPVKEFAWEIIRKDGMRRFGEVSINPIKNPEGQPVGFRGIARDVTERKSAEEALEQSEERYRMLVEESFDGIFIQKGSGIIFANRRLHEMLGYEERELIGLDHWLVYHPDYQDLTRERANARLRGESPPSTYEVKFLRKDGSSFWGEINAKVMSYLGEPGIQVWARDITERKQTEKALIESKETLGMILDGIEADIYIGDLETYEILFMNKHMKESFGNDLVGKVCWRVFRGDSGPCPNCTNPRLLDSEGNPNPVQVWEGKNSITNRYYLNYDRAIRWIDGRYVRLQVATDITDRKRAEEALKESQEKFRFLAEKMADIVWTVDLNFRTTYVSPSIEKVLGFTPQERERQPLEQMVTPESLNRIQDLFLEELQREKNGGADPDRSMVAEVEYYCKDGSTIWMENTIKSMRDAAGAWIGIYGVSRDITERKRAEETLRVEREKFRSLSEDAPFGMAMIAQDGSFKYINPKFYEMFGYELSDIPNGRSWFRKAYPDPDYRHQAISAWKDDFAGSGFGEKRPRIFKIKCKDGSEKIINFISVQLQTGENLMTCEDITDLKQAEAALRQTEEQLRQSQKMEAIGGLAGGIAHDFNNLLTVIKGFAELSFLGLDANDPLRGNIEEIRKASERASSLTRQLLAFSRRQILELKVVNLNSLIQDIDKMLRRILGEDIDLVYRFSEDAGKVKTDPGQIEQVILNLAVNARDAMPSGGVLIIETSSAELPQTYAQTHIDINPGHYVMLSVTDNGSGIPPGVRDRIFEPFFTTKEKGKGTGLGLSTVYGIVKQSGGHIHVYSEPGLGTTFKIYFPKVEEEEDSLQPEQDGIPLFKGSETILLVEDEPAVRELAARILRDRGYLVYEAPDGQETLKMVHNHPDRKIHLLLTDVVMPGMSGRVVADRLKHSMPGMKVLFISGYTDNAIVHHGVLDKGVNFIQKPFTPETLARKVREVLDRS